MKLSEITSYIDPVILDRGRDYLLGGHIMVLDKVKEWIFQAVVEGNELYSVYVELDEDGRIITLECDCPYDYGPVCKHQAAVLLKLREEIPSGSQKDFDFPSTPEKDLKVLLEAQSKDNLVHLPLSLAADSDLVEDRIKLHVSKAGGVEELAECRNLIRTYVNTYSDNYGFVIWRNVGRAVEGAQSVAKKAHEAMENADWVLAVRMNLCIMEEMLSLLQTADDSGGIIGDIIEDSLERIQEVTQSGDRFSQTEVEELFRLLLKESEHSLLEGWSDWQLALLESASRLAKTTDLLREWEEYVSRMISKQEEGTWSGRYFAERIAVLRYRFIQENESRERAKEYLNQNLQFPEFRKFAIQQALDNDSFEEAINLAQEGEELDQARGLPGLVKQWKQFRYEAYRRSGQLDLQRSVGEELVLGGDFSYYHQIKNTYPSAEWPAVYRSMLYKLEKDGWHKEIYTRILVEEQESEKLLEIVKKHPATVEEFYTYLVERFPDEIKRLFQIHIENTANRSSTRKHYQDVCRIIRMLQRARGEAEAEQSVRMLLAKYPRKPAFREKLMKLSFLSES
ncbi:SWIM zinc finger family protein [Effusibacillus consociatus]|uniref:SWIM zinc finger domain-containing protein n=1 Tax=Effusibacillus consociatus TaxID=1117041 RepID=A0ABV9Q6M7_9BACL